MSAKEGGCWPTRQQELLLRAALGEGKEAIDAWYEWHASVDIDRLDPNSQRLLPLVYRNLEGQAATVPGFGRLKGTYRYAWYRNQVLLQVIAASLRAFHDADIETLILEGAALISCYYEDIGSRPMDGFDVLVRLEQAPTAMSVLRDTGWQPKELSMPERSIPVRSSQPFIDEAGRECVLRWRVLHERYQVGGEDDFWDAAVPTRIGAVTTRALGLADQLLHVCVRGAGWSSVPAVRWIPDAVMIVNAASASGNGLDWHRLTTQARKLRLTLPLKDALHYLQDSWDVAVSPAALRSLREAPVSYVERIEHAARIHPPTVPNIALYHWTQNTRSLGDAGILRQLVRFPAYLRGVWGLKHSWQVPFRVMSAVVRRMRPTRSGNRSEQHRRTRGRAQHS